MCGRLNRNPQREASNAHQPAETFHLETEAACGLLDGGVARDRPTGRGCGRGRRRRDRQAGRWRGFIQADNADTYDTMTNNIAIVGRSSPEYVFVIVYATAGQTYLIDEAVAGSTGGCQFTVQGPDEQQNSYPCSKIAGTQQHLVYAYSAGSTGEAWFGTTISNGATGVFSAITVALVE
jgi:hypothetical protein